MDQFPHDNGPRHKDQPAPERTGVRLVHAQPAGPFVRLTLSPVVGERHTMTVRQTIALFREMAHAVWQAEASPAAKDLFQAVEQACEEWEVKDHD